MKIGDRIAYSRSFRREARLPASSRERRGVVVDIDEGIVWVKWDDEPAVTYGHQDCYERIEVETGE